MSPRPKPKSVPSRLGPPPQLSQLHNMKQPPIMMQKKFEPKMREIMARQAKLGSKRSKMLISEISLPKFSRYIRCFINVDVLILVSG